MMSLYPWTCDALQIMWMSRIFPGAVRLLPYPIAVQASYFAFYRKILTGNNDVPYYTVNLAHPEISREITDFDHLGRILAEQFHGICPRRQRCRGCTHGG
jgi:hypothetical protein